MAGKNKDYTPMAIKLQADLSARFDAYKTETGATKTFITEKTVEEYLDRIAPVPDEKE